MQKMDKNSLLEFWKKFCGVIGRIKEKIFSKPIVDIDFIPYACHCSPDTVITQGGDLVQIICIDFRKVKSGLPNDLTLREKIRSIILSIVNAGNMDIAFSLQTVRRGVEVSSLNSFPSRMATRINAVWCDKLKLKQEYDNVLYIGVIIGGLRERLDIKQFVEYIALTFVRARYMRHTDLIFKRLNNITKNIMDNLVEFCPYKLSITKKDGIYYSDFINTLVSNLYLDTKPRPLRDCDLAHYFTSSTIKFGHDAFEISVGDKKKFGCMLAIKELSDVSPETLDKILSHGSDISITETLEFTRRTKNPHVKKTLRELQYQKYLMSISKDSQLASDLKMDGSLRLKIKDLMVYRHTSIMLAEDSLGALEKTAAGIYAAFSEAGYMIYRHDLGIEQAYWAQLPGNFVFIPHRRLVTPHNIANLFHIRSGSVYGDDYWGMPVTYMLDQNNVQNHVSFHYNGSGHLILNDHKARCRVMAHFLLAQAQKFNPTIIYFDATGDESNRMFINLIMGAEVLFDDNGKKKLASFFTNLAHSNQSVDGSSIADMVYLNDGALKAKSELINFSESKNLEDSVTGEVLYFDITKLNNMYYLDNFLHALKIAKCTCQNPMVVLFNRPWEMLSYLSVERMKEFLLDLEKIGGMAIFLCDRMDQEECRNYAQAIGGITNSKIFFTTTQAREWYKPLGASDYVADWLRMVARKDGEAVIFKKGESVHPLKFEYRNIKDFALLLPDKDLIFLLNQCFAKYGPDVNSWIDRLSFEEEVV